MPNKHIRSKSQGMVSYIFLNKDVAEWIGHNNLRMMLQGADDSEKTRNIVTTLGGVDSYEKARITLYI